SRSATSQTLLGLGVFGGAGLLEPELLEPVPERSERDAEPLRGALLHAAGLVERLEQEPAFVLREHVLERDALRWKPFATGCRSRAHPGRRQYGGVDLAAPRERHGALHDVLELAHVAGIVVGHELLERRVAHALHLAPELALVLLHEVRHEQ